MKYSRLVTSAGGRPPIREWAQSPKNLCRTIALRPTESIGRRPNRTGRMTRRRRTPGLATPEHRQGMFNPLSPPRHQRDGRVAAITARDRPPPGPGTPPDPGRRQGRAGARARHRPAPVTVTVTVTVLPVAMAAPQRGRRGVARATSRRARLSDCPLKHGTPEPRRTHIPHTLTRRFRGRVCPSSARDDRVWAPPLPARPAAAPPHALVRLPDWYKIFNCWYG